MRLGSAIRADVSGQRIWMQYHLEMVLHMQGPARKCSRPAEARSRRPEIQRLPKPLVCTAVQEDGERILKTGVAGKGHSRLFLYTSALGRSSSGGTAHPGCKARHELGFDSRDERQGCSAHEGRTNVSCFHQENPKLPTLTHRLSSPPGQAEAAY